MRYFKEAEFRCPCCGKSEMNVPFIDRLDKARDIAGIPFRLTSAYRCDIHNKAVGGKPDSAHTKGLAVDIQAIGSRNRYLVVRALIAVGLHRIGIGGDFVHVDNDMSKDKEVIWLY